MTDFEGKVAVIIGGATGIGLALASRAADQGMKVALVDSDESRLAAALQQVKAQNAEAITVPIDTSDADAVRALARRTQAELGPPWLVCNNSGLSHLDSDWKLTSAHLKWRIGMNLWGVINGVQVFAPGMVERDAGHIVNVASTDLFGIPGAAAYVATTHAIVGLSESLYRELDAMGSQVGVTVACPALGNTTVASATRVREIAHTAGMSSPSPPLAREVALNALSPEEFAKEIFAAVTARRFWLFPRVPSMRESSACRSDAAVGIRGKVLTSDKRYAKNHTHLAAAARVSDLRKSH